MNSGVRQVSLLFLLSIGMIGFCAADQLQLTEVLPEVSAGRVPANGVNPLDPQGLFGVAGDQDQQAFSSVSRSAMPMTPDQIVQLKEMVDVTQRASAASGGVPPHPTLSTQYVALSPGALPPVIRLQQGFVTSVVFVDETGAEWPLEGYDLGNSKAFNIQWQEGSNILIIQALGMYTYGNLAVKLRGLSTPVMVTLIPGQRVVDYRADLRIQGRGPNASGDIQGGGALQTSDTLLQVLDGIPPSNAKVLSVAGGRAQAWSIGNRMYVRTRFSILSPGWIGKLSSPDGMHAYELENSAVLLVSRQGKPVQLQIEGL